MESFFYVFSVMESYIFKKEVSKLKYIGELIHSGEKMCFQQTNMNFYFIPTSCISSNTHSYYKESSFRCIKHSLQCFWVEFTFQKMFYVDYTYLF
jgi:hypothetical protein